ncbi:MAG: signal recognition particle protein, partial [Anaerolineales bacterium]|nr:signal recognition particle protein [Anaerolineales bacterium]
KMGSMSQILDMVPGAGQLAQEVSSEEADRQFKRMEAIITSMTPEERRSPRILNGSRKRRVARGSGTTVQDINILLNQFRQMQQMMKQMRKGSRGMRGLMRLFG